MTRIPSLQTCAFHFFFFLLRRRCEEEEEEDLSQESVSCRTQSSECGRVLTPVTSYRSSPIRFLGGGSVCWGVGARRRGAVSYAAPPHSAKILFAPTAVKSTLSRYHVTHMKRNGERETHRAPASLQITANDRRWAGIHHLQLH